MIRKLLRRVLKSTIGRANGKPRIIPLAAHGLSRDQLSPCALKTTETLQRAGYAAFVVGGAVRDLLMGRPPKDFDVATNATPAEVQALFRRARLIGRRFQLVHVLCGRETIEVSTFRGTANHGGQGERHTDDTGRLVRDNVFGSQSEDAARRDFTANALYYDPGREEILDYHDGVSDIRKQVLRMIGDAEQRYREDPVRMLRAARFAARLDFHIDAATRAPTAKLGPLLQHVPESRLFDEMLKLLLSGHALRGVHQLRAEGLHHGLLPLLDTILEQPAGERFVTLALKNTDQRIAQGKPVSPAFLLATLLWHEVLTVWQRLEAEGMNTFPALYRAMDDVLTAQGRKLVIPRRYDAMMKEIWGLQPRFLFRAGVRPFRLLENPRFRAGFDFLLLRCESGESDAEIGQWWEDFQHADDEARKTMLLAAGSAPKRRRRRRKRTVEPATDNAEIS